MRKWMLIGMFILLPILSFGQTHHDFFIDQDEMVLQIDLSKSNQSIDSLLKVAGIKSADINAIRKGNLDLFTKDHWTVQRNAQGLELRRSLNYLTELNGSNLIQILDQIFTGGDPNYDTNASYGVNHFAKLTVTETDDGFTHFFLPSYKNAQKVVLSGSFNQWSLEDDLMKRTANGWEVAIKLKPGKHLYKYIVDGNWATDPSNLQKQADGHYGYNSVYFKYNHTFELLNHSNANQVILSGSFNQWNPEELRMHLLGNRWVLPMYLKQGRHEYKFVVDGNWITDPQNPITVSDGHGIENSVLFIGENVNFSVIAPKAKQVALAGDFNHWQAGVFMLQKVNEVWKTTCQIPEGNHQYRFIVDGNWMPDPNNPYTAMDNGIVNSLLVVHPNQTFKLKGFLNANLVSLSGDFNSWDPYGYTMKKVSDGWMIQIHLDPGKHFYKFVVDGRWMIDPSNPLYESDGAGNDNSVIWVDQNQ